MRLFSLAEYKRMQSYYSHIHTQKYLKYISHHLICKWFVNSLTCVCLAHLGGRGHGVSTIRRMWWWHSICCGLKMRVNHKQVFELITIRIWKQLAIIKFDSFYVNVSAVDIIVLTFYKCRTTHYLEVFFYFFFVCILAVKLNARYGMFVIRILCGSVECGDVANSSLWPLTIYIYRN